MKHHKLTTISSACEIVLGENWKSKSQKREHVFKRNIFYRVCKRLTLASLDKIGAQVGRDHATVLHGLRSFENDIWEGHNDRDGHYINLYRKCLVLSEKMLFSTKATEWSKLEKLLHKNIELRGEIQKLKTAIRILT